MFQARLAKEKKNLMENGAQNGLTLFEYGPDRPNEVEIELRGPEGSVYHGEVFRIYFNFTEK